MKKITFLLNGLFFNNLKPMKKNVVYLNGDLVPYGEFDQTDYAWGYSGGGPTSLTMSIMKALNLPKTCHDNLYKKIAALPKDRNFSKIITISTEA